MENIEINSILRDFYKISGFRISIHNLEFNEIYSYPQKLSLFCEKAQENSVIKTKCIKKDAEAFEKVKSTEKAYLYKCHCGLYEAVAPIYHYGVLSGYFMMGQVCDERPESKEYILKYMVEHNVNQDDIAGYVDGIKTIDEQLIYSYINIMKIIAEYITRSNKLNTYADSLAPLVKKYINMNYKKRITLAVLSQKFDCCNSNLMNCFKKEYGITIMEYLTEVRLNNAETMVALSNKPFKEISADCGFYDQNYFSKLFTKRYGMSPGKYRKYKNNID